MKQIIFKLLVFYTVVVLVACKSKDGDSMGHFMRVSSVFCK